MTDTNITVTEEVDANGQPLVTTPPATPPTPPVPPVTSVPADDKVVTKQEPETIEKTGDAFIDESVALLVATENLTATDITRAIGVACERKDPTLIDTAFIEERFKDKAPYVKALAERYVSTAVSEVDKLNTQIYDLVGGEENWGVVRDIFRGGASDHLMQAAQALVASGNDIAAAKLMIDYATSTGLVGNQKTPLKGGAPAGVKPLTEAEFKGKIKELQMQAGRQSLNSPKFRDAHAQLMAARKSGKSLGI